MTGPRLNEMQRAALAALRAAPDGLSPAELGAVTGRPKEGAAMTASALARKGLVVCSKVDGRRRYVAVTGEA